MRILAGTMCACTFVVAALAACGGSESAPTPAATSTPSAPPPTATATTIPPSPTPQPTATPAPSGAPTGLIIPSIGTNLPVRSVGLTAARQIEDVAQGEVGFYTLSDPVGQPGNSFWIGNRDGSFGGLMDTIRTGAEVFIPTASGGRYVYTVMSLTKFTVAELDMGKVLYPKLEPTEQRLTILTSADLDPQTGNDLSYWVVVANRKP